MYQVFKPTILNSHSLRLMESQSKSTAKPQSLRQAPVHCDSISKLPVITSRCKSTCNQPLYAGQFGADSHGRTGVDQVYAVRTSVSMRSMIASKRRYERWSNDRDYDLNWVINRTTRDGLELAARVYEPTTGPTMEMWSDQPECSSTAATSSTARRRVSTDVRSASANCWRSKRNVPPTVRIVQSSLL